MQKKLLLNLLLAVVMLIPFTLVSCGGDNFGYPSKITFGKDGGTINCPGASGFYVVEIDDYNGTGASSFGPDTDSIRVTYDWLTAKCKKFGTQLKLIATPNHSGKKRRLYVYGAVDDDNAEIEVVQK